MVTFRPKNLDRVNLGLRLPATPISFLRTVSNCSSDRVADDDLSGLALAGGDLDGEAAICPLIG